MAADIDKLKSEPGVNITYLRHMAGIADVAGEKALSQELHRACDDIEAYREIVGLVLHGGLHGDRYGRLEELLDAMTWGNDAE